MNDEELKSQPNNLKMAKIIVLIFFFMLLFLQVTLSTMVIRAAFLPTVSYWAPGLHLATFLPPTPTPTAAPSPSPTPFCIETCQADCGCI